MKVRAGLLATISTVALMSSMTGCTLQTSDADKYRSAVPQPKDVALGVPGSSASGTAAQSARGVRFSGSHAAGLGVQGGVAGSGNAEFYQFTRDITDGVDVVTAVILGAINAVVAETPTTVSAKQAVWGPYQGSALEPVVWRFTVNEVGPSEYDYKLEGRPREKTSESDFVSVLTGHGYGKDSALHRKGWFQADNDAYRTLDPARGHDYGTTKITYDLVNLDDPSLAGEIDADLAPGAGKGALAIKVHHLPGGAGELDITGQAALDNTKPSVLEDVNLKNRWDTTGAGRADVVATGGSLPSELDVVECWSSSFARVYYTDNLNIHATEGSATACTIAK